MLSIEELISAQKEDSEIKELKPPDYRAVELVPNQRVICLVEDNNIRPFVPKNLRLAVFKSYHDLAHQGQKSYEETNLGEIFLAGDECGYYFLDPPLLYLSIVQNTSACKGSSYQHSRA